MTIIERLTDKLAEAHRTNSLVTLDAELDALAVDDAPAVQVAVMQRLGESAPASKVAITAEGRAVIAPMFGSRFVDSGSALPAAGATGLEVEIAVRLGRDLAPGVNVLSAIDGFFVGVELIGPRLANHRKAGLGALLADNLVGNGYVINRTTPWLHGPDIGFRVVVEVDGRKMHDAPAVNPFGGVLVALETYLQAPFDCHGALRAGHVFTTGTLCGVIPVSSPCRIDARIGEGPAVKVTLL